MNKLPEDWLKQLKAEYPKRSRGKGYGWPEAYIHIQKHLKVHSFEDILQGTKDYCAASKISGDYGTEFIKMASSFYNQLGFLDEYELEEAIPEVKYRRPPVDTETPEEKQAKFERDLTERFKLRSV